MDGWIPTMTFASAETPSSTCVMSFGKTSKLDPVETVLNSKTSAQSTLGSLAAHTNTQHPNLRNMLIDLASRDKIGDEIVH